MVISAIVKEFLELVKIDVQSRNERMITYVLKNKLTDLGLEVTEDGTATKVGIKIIMKLEAIKCLFLLLQLEILYLLSGYRVMIKAA